MSWIDGVLDCWINGIEAIAQLIDEPNGYVLQLGSSISWDRVAFC